MREGGAGVRGDVCGAHEAAEAVVRGPGVEGVCRARPLQGGGGVGVDVVGVGRDFDVFGLDDAIPIQARDPLRLGETGGGVGGVGAGGGRGALAASTRAAPQAGFPHRRATGLALLFEFDAGRVADAGVGEGHELVEHGELEFELDAVDHRFQRRFDLVPVGVHHGQQDEVHGDDDQVDPDQLRHDFSRLAVVDGPQQLDGRVHVDGRDDELLHAESGHLKLLDDDEAMDEGLGFIRIGAVGQNGGGDVKTDRVHDDHRQHQP